jgi:hypothetical protein
MEMTLDRNLLRADEDGVGIFLLHADEDREGAFVLQWCASNNAVPSTYDAITTKKCSMISAVNILFISAMLADTNRSIPKIATFKYRLFSADTKDQFSRRKKTTALRSRHVGPRSGPAAIDAVPP